MTAFLKGTSVPAVWSRQPNTAGGLSVLVSFVLDSTKDALALAAYGKAFVVQAARRGRTEVSTKQFDCQELFLPFARRSRSAEHGTQRSH